MQKRALPLDVLNIRFKLSYETCVWEVGMGVAKESVENTYE